MPMNMIRMKKLRKAGFTWLLHGFALLSTIMFVVLQFYDPAVVREHVETMTYDFRMYFKSLTDSAGTPQEIVIVAVDEKSIAEIGRWPWDRAVQAELVRAVSSGAPRAIGIDIMYSESQDEANDSAFASALSDAGNVALATNFLATDEGLMKVKHDFLWDHAFMAVKSTDELPWQQWTVKPVNVLPPDESIASSAFLGSVLTPPDLDGVIRWEILYVFFDGDYYPSMPLQVARMYLGVSMEDMLLVGGRGVKLDQKMISADLSGRALINYYGSYGHFRYYSAADVMRGRVDPRAFEGRAVLIGGTAVATYDQKATPLSANMPGVEKNATVVKNILDGDFMRKSPGAVEIVVTVVTGLVLTLLLVRMSAVRGAMLAVFLMMAYVLANTYVFINNSLWMNLTYPLGNMAMIFTVQVTSRYLVEERKAKKMRHMFSSYVSPGVVAALIENPEMARLGGQRKEVTVLFSDIAGFTSLSENMDPEEVVSRLNEYFKAMTDVIFHWRGTFDKIVGDEIMAFWGAPVEQPNHPELAVRCALEMFKVLRALQIKWIGEGKPLIDIGIGINTGEVLVGNIGAEDKKMDYTIIGDHVNAGARVEALTRQFNAKILMTEFTAERIKPLIESKRIGHVELRYRGSTKVKGKARELGIYELVELEAEQVQA